MDWTIGRYGSLWKGGERICKAQDGEGGRKHTHTRHTHAHRKKRTWRRSQRESWLVTVTPSYTLYFIMRKNRTVLPLSETLTTLCVSRVENWSRVHTTSRHELSSRAQTLSTATSDFFLPCRLSLTFLVIPYTTIPFRHTLHDNTFPSYLIRQYLFVIPYTTIPFRERWTRRCLAFSPCRPPSITIDASCLKPDTPPNYSFHIIKSSYVHSTEFY